MRGRGRRAACVQYNSSLIPHCLLVTEIIVQLDPGWSIGPEPSYQRCTALCANLFLDGEGDGGNDQHYEETDRLEVPQSNLTHAPQRYCLYLHSSRAIGGRSKSVGGGGRGVEGSEGEIMGLLFELLQYMIYI